MNPIVDPRFVYFLSIVNGIKGIFYMALVVFAVGCITYVGTTLSARANYFYNKSLQKMWVEFWSKKLVFFLWFFLGISIIGSICIPSKKTLLQMYVADKITYDFVSETLSAGKSLKDEIKDDIIEIIQGVQTTDEVSE